MVVTNISSMGSGMVEKCRFDKKERRNFFDEEYVSNEPKPILKALNFDQPHFI